MKADRRVVEVVSQTDDEPMAFRDGRDLDHRDAGAEDPAA